MTRTNTKYLILGGGAAGYYAALSIRQRDPLGSVILVSEEQIPPYKRPMLSKSPLKSLRSSAMEMASAHWFAKNSIELRLGCTARLLDAERKCVETDRGDIYYEKCVYALGAQCFIPPIKGAQLEGVVSIRTIEDVRRLKRYAAGVDSAVVIGGGVIGLEMALELHRYGMKVTVLEAMPRLMPRQLDTETSHRLAQKLSGLHLHTGVSIAEIRGTSRAESVILEDGRIFPCGLVVISAGVKANTSLALAAGIECGRAVKVNDKMETSRPDIWACGDCAEQNGVNMALWFQAEAQGLAAGSNAAGGSEQVGGFDRSLILNNDAVSLFALGDLGEDCQCISQELAYDGFTINAKPRSAVEKRFYRGGRIVGGCILGNLSGMESMKREIEGGMPR